jgi:hypothetical protein
MWYKIGDPVFLVDKRNIKKNNMTDSWKFFVIEVTYRIPAEELGERVAVHRAYLQVGYDQGWLLMSGTAEPKDGRVDYRAGAFACSDRRFFQPRSVSGDGAGRLPVCGV